MKDGDRAAGTFEFGVTWDRCDGALGNREGIGDPGIRRVKT